MAEPLGATTNKETGFRTYPNPVTGQKATSVTTILGILNKPALVPWAAKKAGERAVGEYEELQRRMSGETLNPVTGKKYTKEEIRKWISAAPNEKRDSAAVRGSLVHDIAEREAAGETVEIPEDLKEYVDGYRLFVEQYDVDFQFTETTFLHTTLNYAGTADFGATMWGTMDDSVVIGDWKTGATGPYLEWAYQLVAYANANATLVRDGALIKTGPMPEVSKTRAALVRLLKGRYELYWIGEGTEIPMTVLWDGFKGALLNQRIKNAAGDRGKKAFTRG